jgi:DNA-damage-inducible protein D
MSESSLPPESDRALDVFHFEDGRVSFDDLGQENGFRFWSARRLMELLEYSSWDSFSKVVNKGIGVCMTIGSAVPDHFVQCEVEIDGVRAQFEMMAVLA